LDLAGTYRAASDTAEVGGDWFDAVEVFRGNGGSVVDLVVGDVQGHDGEAAALMARLGSVVRADSQKGRGPVEIVVDLDRFHRSLNTERLTTLALARLHTGTGTVHFVNAGHPPPLLVRNGVAQVATTIVSPPIGAGAFPRQVEQLALQPDDLLVLFSDGLLDPRADTDDALRKLAALATSARGRALPELVEMLVASTTDHEPSDDVVVLATRWTPGR
jgi:serine phosphatase RsbU (regulator of sigma subunit)